MSRRLSARAFCAAAALAVAACVTTASVSAHGTICHRENDATTNVGAALTAAVPAGTNRSTAWQFTPLRTSFPQAAWIFTGSPNGNEFMQLEVWTDSAGAPGTRMAYGTCALPQSATPDWRGVNFNTAIQIQIGTPYWFVWIESGDVVVPEEPGGTLLPKATRTGTGAWSAAGTGAGKIRLFCGDTLEGLDVLRLGTGCGTSFDLRPVAWSNELPNVGNSEFAIEGEHLPPGANAWLAVGFNPNFFPLSLDILIGAPFGCVLFTDTTVVFAGATGSAAVGSGTPGNRPAAYGHVRFPLPIPNDPSLQMLYLSTQILAIDAGAPEPVPVVTTNGLSITVQ